MKSLYILLFLALLSPYSIAEKQPNILFIFTDDFAYNATGFSGNKTVKTPHLDSLAKSGTTFTHAYNSGSWSGAVCIASRTMLMTGQQVWNASATFSGVTHEELKGKKNLWHSNKLLKEMKQKGQLWPQIMQNAGYETYYAGKWHTGGHNIAKSWQNLKNIRPGMPNQTRARYQRKFDENGKSSWDPTDTSKRGFWGGGKHWSEVLAEDGIHFLDQASKQDKPWLITLSFNAPHDPRQAPKKFQDMYPYSSIELPKSFQPEYPYQIGSNRIRDENLAAFPRTKLDIQANLSEYYALISHTDEQVGRVIKHLKKLKLDKNTIIIFTADHGLAVGSHGLVGKQNMHEHSVRVPWFITGPKIPKNKKISTPIYLQDVMATCIDLAQTEKPKHVDFNSVLPLIKSPKRKNHTIYGAYTNFQRMLIYKNFKLIVYPQINVELLYYLKQDPLELKNLADKPEYASKLKVLRKKLVKKMQEMNDPITLEAPTKNYPYRPAPNKH